MLPARTFLLLSVGLAGAVGLASSCTASDEDKPLPQPPAKAELKAAAPFVDLFDSIDRKSWSVSDGWSNGPYMVNDWRAGHARLEDGLNLFLGRNKTQLADYSSGELQTISLYGHGYFEARLRAAPGSGIVTGFFTYIGPHWKKPWNEIDFEILGSKPRSVQLTYFTDGKKVSETLSLPFDATRSFHVYGFDWQPDGIRWYLDGRLIHESKGDALPLPYEKQKIMMSVWGSRTLGDWVGPFDEGSLPTSATFTCVAYSPSFETGRRCEDATPSQR